jgi:DNA polymerase-1
MLLVIDKDLKILRGGYIARINWTEAILLEHEVAGIIRDQEEYGVYFNIAKAKYYISLLEKMKEEKYLLIRPHLNYEVIIEETKDKKEDRLSDYNYVRKIKLKNGEYTASVLNWFPDPDIVGAEFSRISIEEPSISKRQLIIKQLLSLGWKPEEFTETGLPKLTEKGLPVDTIAKVGDFGKDLADWYTYNHRQSQITGFLPYVRSDSRIAAQCQACATNTFRAKHRVVANIPRPTSTFGKEMRSLFGVREGRVFVGADLSGLELRMLCHHMNDAEYTAQVLTGDIHTFNKEKAGLFTRDQAKTFIYAFLYGAGDGKIGSIINGSSKQGKILKDTFFEAIPALRDLVTRVQTFAQKNGWLPSIDGRKIFVRRFEGKVLVHTALNTLLQANGSIIAKRAMVIAYYEIKRRDLDAHQLLFYHDEFAYDTLPELGEEVGQILIDSMRLAGEYYKLNIPIAGEYKIGMDWGVH